MKFVWYIINIDDGLVEGTNDTEGLIRSGLLKSESHVVLHSSSGAYVNPESGECDQEIAELNFDGPVPDGEDDEP